jgi:hypothetical protein
MLACGCKNAKANQKLEPGGIAYGQWLVRGVGPRAPVHILRSAVEFRARGHCSGDQGYARAAHGGGSLLISGCSPIERPERPALVKPAVRFQRGRNGPKGISSLVQNPPEALRLYPQRYPDVLSVV